MRTESAGSEIRPGGGVHHGPVVGVPARSGGISGYHFKFEDVLPGVVFEAIFD